MAAYLIYLPGLDLAAQAKLQKIPDLLGMLGNSPGLEWKEVHEDGPDGKVGHLGMFGGASSFFGLNFNQQWSQSPCGKYWIGWENSSAPHPVDLERNELRESNPIDLADGNEWQVPVAHMLPYYMGVDSTGHFGKTVKPEFRSFFDESLKWLERFEDLAEQAKSGEATVYFDEAEAFAFACRALSINYLVNPFVLTQLKVFDQETMPEVIGATFGYVKKKT